MPALPVRLALLCSLLLPTLAQAHYLWLEEAGTGYRLRFGEYEEAVYERSPGRLDEMPAPQAWSRQPDKAEAEAVLVKRESDGFMLAAAGKAGVWLQEDKVAVKDLTRSGIGIFKPMYYARFAPVPASVEPQQRLDIVPTGKAGEFGVYFAGKPLAGAAMKIVAPNGWLQEGKTDAEGRVRLPLPWRGPYVVQTVHLEPVPGEFGGQPYEALRHVATLSFTQQRGEKTFRPDFRWP